MRAQLIHRYLVPAASYLPNRILRWLDKHWRIGYDSSDGWTTWMDASYHAWCRKHRQ